MDGPDAPERLDKWLWAARLLKTRALAAQAVRGGRVEVNGRPSKPGRDVRPGDRVRLTTGPVAREVDVRGTAPRRLPAAEAALLYEETAASVAARERHAAERRLAPDPRAEPAAARRSATAAAWSASAPSAAAPRPRAARLRRARPAAPRRGRGGGTRSPARARAAGTARWPSVTISAMSP